MIDHRHKSMAGIPVEGTFPILDFQSKNAVVGAHHENLELLAAASVVHYTTHSEHRQRFLCSSFSRASTTQKDECEHGRRARLSCDQEMQLCLVAVLLMMAPTTIRPVYQYPCLRHQHE